MHTNTYTRDCIIKIIQSVTLKFATSLSMVADLASLKTGDIKSICHALQDRDLLVRAYTKLVKDSMTACLLKILMNNFKQQSTWRMKFILLFKVHGYLILYASPLVCADRCYDSNMNTHILIRSLLATKGLFTVVL